MKLHTLILVASALLGAVACRSDKQQPSSNPENTVTERGIEAVPRATHNCTIAGSMLDGNQFWVRDAEVLVAVVADSTTYNAELEAEGHRILEVYDTKDCSRILRQVLPVNISPDFAYYIAEITYNKITQIVAIKGPTSVYCYDVQARRLMPRMTPKYRSPRESADAQSGQIQRLEVWENYLIGYAQDHGVFVFDLKNRQSPQPVMPVAEYRMDEINFAPLFLLQPEGEGMQAIMPEYKRETNEFEIHPGFTEPIQLNSNIQQSAANNRYIVLRAAENNQAVAFDLVAHRRVELPADIAAKNTQEVLRWVRTNVQ